MSLQSKLQDLFAFVLKYGQLIRDESFEFDGSTYRKVVFLMERKVIAVDLCDNTIYCFQYV